MLYVTVLKRIVLPGYSQRQNLYACIPCVQLDTVKCRLSRYSVLMFPLYSRGLYLKISVLPEPHVVNY
jgi:hypothetical protein